MGVELSLPVNYIGDVARDEVVMPLLLDVRLELLLRFALLLAGSFDLDPENLLMMYVLDLAVSRPIRSAEIEKSEDVGDAWSGGMKLHDAAGAIAQRSGIKTNRENAFRGEVIEDLLLDLGLERSRIDRLALARDGRSAKSTQLPSPAVSPRPTSFPTRQSRRISRRCRASRGRAACSLFGMSLRRGRSCTRRIP